jgi:hypothetical protein
MNNPTSTQKSSTPSKSNRAERARKRINTPAEGAVEAQIAGCEASGEAAKGVNNDGTPFESAPVETASGEKLASVPVESVKITETADELASGANGKMMGKLRRAFLKAGKPEVSEAEISAFLASLLEAKVPVLNRSSGRIARVLKGEKSIENLLLARLPSKSA